jgi:hypothetical protein
MEEADGRLAAFRAQALDACKRVPAHSARRKSAGHIHAAARVSERVGDEPEATETERKSRREGALLADIRRGAARTDGACAGAKA